MQYIPVNGGNTNTMASVCNLRWKGTLKGAHSTMAENVYNTATDSMIGMPIVDVELAMDFCLPAEPGMSRQTRPTTPNRKTTTHFVVRSSIAGTNIRVVVFDEGTVPCIAGFSAVKIMDETSVVRTQT